MLFISHNLGLILDTCDRLCVMYSGEAVETGSIEDVFDKMRHPYTQALFRSIPFQAPIKTKAHLWQFQVIFHYLMSVLMDVILALDVTILKPVGVTPAK